MDLATFLGVRVMANAYLPDGVWVLGEDGSVVVAHDLWEKLRRQIFEVELLTDYAED